MFNPFSKVKAVPTATINKAVPEELTRLHSGASDWEEHLMNPNAGRNRVDYDQHVKTTQDKISRARNQKQVDKHVADLQLLKTQYGIKSVREGQTRRQAAGLLGGAAVVGGGKMGMDAIKAGIAAQRRKAVMNTVGNVAKTTGIVAGSAAGAGVAGYGAYKLATPKKNKGH